MIYDLLEYFKDNPESSKMVLDNYMLKSGLYIRLNKDGTEDILVVKKNDPLMGDLYNWFKRADYYSYITDTNKAFDAPKKIMHNNNYNTLFFKTKSIIESNTVKTDFPDHILNFYEKLMRKLDSKEVIAFSEKAELPPVKQDLVMKNRDIILKKLTQITQKVIELELKDDDYIKLFFEENLESYQAEYIRYYYPYIFNKNDFNIEYNDTIYGLSAANMGLNTKKPFLEHKTTNFKVPFRISLEDAMEAKKLFEWLSTQKDDNGKPLNKGYIPLSDDNSITLEPGITKKRNMHYIHVEKGTDTIISDYDFLPGITEEIDRFIPENFLMIEYYNAETTSLRWRMEQLVDQYLYNSKLIRHYKTPHKDIKGLSSQLLNLLLISRKAMEDFFVKGDDSAIVSCIDKVTAGLVKEKLNAKESKFFTNTGQALNIRLALLKYFKIGGKENMGSIVKEMWNILNEKINSKTLIECDSDVEFYFASGQLARYIISQSEARELKHNMADPLINAKSTAKFKEELKALYAKYSHSFKFTGRFNNLLSMVMGYIPQDHQVSNDIFLAGLAARNVMYEKKEAVEQ